FLPHDATWLAKLDAALVAGTQPDVVQGPVSEAAKYIPLGAVSPIDDYTSKEDKDDIVKEVATESSFGGKNYVWPWRLSFGGGRPEAAASRSTGRGGRRRAAATGGGGGRSATGRWTTPQRRSRRRLSTRTSPASRTSTPPR